jgi:hypothetical protein
VPARLYEYAGRPSKGEGAEQSPRRRARSPITIPHDADGLKDCGSDLTCFLAALGRIRFAVRQRLQHATGTDAEQISHEARHLDVRFLEQRFQPILELHVSRATIRGGAINGSLGS